MEGLGRIFSGFSAEGVGGGVEEKIAFHEAALKNGGQILNNKILIICIRKRIRWIREKAQKKHET